MDESKPMTPKELNSYQKHLRVTNKEVYGMIEALIKAGYSKPEFAYLCSSGQTYSFAFDEIQANIELKKLNP